MKNTWYWNIYDKKIECIHGLIACKKYILEYKCHIQYINNDLFGYVSFVWFNIFVTLNNK